MLARGRWRYTSALGGGGDGAACTWWPMDEKQEERKRKLSNKPSSGKEVRKWIDARSKWQKKRPSRKKPLKEEALATSSGSPGPPNPLNMRHFASQLLKPGIRTKTSLVWNFFHIDPQYICRATCNICRMSVSRGRRATQLGTSTLQRHLQARHPTHWALAQQTDGVAGCDLTEQPSTTTASESVDLSSGRARSPEPDHPILARFEDYPLANLDQSPSNKNSREGPFVPDIPQPEETLVSENVIKDVEPLSAFPADFTPGEVEGALVQNSSQLPPKRAKRSKSLVWKFFIVDRKYPSKATCVVCTRSVSRGRPGTQLGTSTLQRHLLARHPVHWSMANECSDALEGLDYALRVSLPPVFTEGRCSAPAGGDTLYSAEAMHGNPADVEESTEQYVHSLNVERGHRTNGNIKQEPDFSNCADKAEPCVSRLHIERGYWSSEKPKQEPVASSSCAGTEGPSIGRLRIERGYWASENPKQEPVALSSCAVTEGPCVGRLHIKRGYWASENPKQEPVTSSCVEMPCVGRLPIEWGYWTSESPKQEHVPLSSCAGTEGPSVGRLHIEQGYWASENPKTEPVALSSCVGTEEDSSRVKLDASAICHAGGSGDKERFREDPNEMMCVRLLSRRSKRVTSPVWLFFYIDPQFPSRAVCNVCQMSVSRGRPGTPLGTSTLQRHLLARHREHWDMANKDEQYFGARVAEQSCQQDTPTLTSAERSNVNRASTAEHACPVVSSAHPREHQRQEVKEEKQQADQTPRKKKKNKNTGARRQPRPKRLIMSSTAFSAEGSSVAPCDAGTQLVSSAGNKGNVADVDSYVPFTRKRTKRVTSPVWNFFYTDPACCSHAICIVCKRSVSRGKPGTQLGTSTLQRHLLAKHPVHWQLVILNEEGLPGE